MELIERPNIDVCRKLNALSFSQYLDLYKKAPYKKDEEGEDIDISIRDEIIELLKNKGYRYDPAEEETDEIHDFFIKDNQLIQVIINGDIPEDVLEQIAKEWRIRK